MSAETLRKAATKMREDHPWDQSGSAFYTDVAAWLDAEAAIWEGLLHIQAKVTPAGYQMSWGESTQGEAVAVARTYLGETDS